MKMLSLLEVCEVWMMNPDQKFEDENGEQFFMNKYGFIEGENGLLNYYNDMNKKVWRIV